MKDKIVEGIFRPSVCPRGLTDCEPLSYIVAEDCSSFFCCGENDGTGRQLKQDKYTFCFKNEDIDELSHNDKRDLVHKMAVLSRSLAIIEEGDSDSYHVKR